MAAPTLTSGAISQIYSTKETTSKPLLQVVDLKQINASGSGGAPPRYRLSVSDGEYFQQAMLATQLNKLIANQDLALNAVLRMSDYITNEVANKRIIIILCVEVISNPGHKIGTPVNVEALSRGSAENTPRTVVAQKANTVQPEGNSHTSAGFRTQAGGGWHAGGKSSGVSPTSVMPVSRAPANARFRDIQSINPYQNGWVIRGRCTYKSDIRTFVNQRGEGKLISFELTDNSGSIRVTAFTEQADMINQKVQPNRVFIVSKATLKQANEKYNRSTSSFEMTLGRESELHEDTDDGTVAKIKYNFTKIAGLEGVEVKCACDVVAVVHSVGEVAEITIRSTGEPVKKRSIMLVDDSNASVELTLWRLQAENLVTEADLDRHPIIVLRNASRGDFGGVCLNTSRGTTIELDPTNVPEANALRGWYDAGGVQDSSLQSMSNSMSKSTVVLGDRKSLEEARVEDVQPGIQDGTVAFAMRGYVSFMKKDKELSYPSDPETKKKLIEGGAPGMWHSESTGRQFTDAEVVHRYICNMKVSDYSGSNWMTGFDESASVIIGRSASDMRTLRQDDVRMFENIVDDCFFRPLVMKVTVKQDNYNDELRLRYVIQRVQATNFVTESRALLTEIRQYGLTV